MPLSPEEKILTKSGWSFYILQLFTDQNKAIVRLACEGLGDEPGDNDPDGHVNEMILRMLVIDMEDKSFNVEMKKYHLVVSCEEWKVLEDFQRDVREVLDKAKELTHDDILAKAEKLKGDFPVLGEILEEYKKKEARWAEFGNGIRHSLEQPRHKYLDSATDLKITVAWFPLSWVKGVDSVTISRITPDNAERASELIKTIMNEDIQLDGSVDELRIAIVPEKHGTQEQIQERISKIPTIKLLLFKEPKPKSATEREDERREGKDSDKQDPPMR